MKTLEEAIDQVILHADSQGELMEMAAKQALVIQAYKPIIDEISRNEKVRTFAHTFASHVGNGISLESALASALVNGVIIGIEMEKTEWPSSQSKWGKKITDWWGRMAKRG